MPTTPDTAAAATPTPESGQYSPEHRAALEELGIEPGTTTRPYNPIDPDDGGNEPKGRYSPEDRAELEDLGIEPGTTTRPHNAVNPGDPRNKRPVGEPSPDEPSDSDEGTPEDITQLMDSAEEASVEPEDFVEDDDG